MVNPIVPTPPVGDSSNRAASSQFVATAVASAVAQAIASTLATSITNFLNGSIGTPLNQGYRIVEYCVFPMTLNFFAAKLATGALTATLSINTTVITGGTATIGTAQVSGLLTAANTATTGNAIVLTVIGTASGPTDLSYVIRYTRTLG